MFAKIAVRIIPYCGLSVVGLAIAILIARLTNTTPLGPWESVGLVVTLVVAVVGCCLLFIFRPRPKTTPTAAAADGKSQQHESAKVFQKRQAIFKTLSNNVNALFDGSIEVRHVMSRNPLSIKPNAALRTAMELMQEHGIHHLLVCDDDSKLLGTLSSHYSRRSEATRVKEVMRTDPPTVTADARLNPTITQMIEAGCSCIPVVQGDQAVGVITTADIQMSLQCALQLLFRATTHERIYGSDTTTDTAPVPPLADAAADELTVV